MDKIWHIHTTKYYLAIKKNEVKKKKKNEVLIHGTTWMNLENMMFNEQN